MALAFYFDNSAQNVSNTATNPSSPATEKYWN